MPVIKLRLKTSGEILPLEGFDILVDGEDIAKQLNRPGDSGLSTLSLALLMGMTGAGKAASDAVDRLDREDGAAAPRR